MDHGNISGNETSKNKADDPSEETCLPDLMRDRMYHHALKSCQVKIMYAKWHIGQITCCRFQIGECRVLFDDYRNINEINGVDIIL